MLPGRADVFKQRRGGQVAALDIVGHHRRQQLRRIDQRIFLGRADARFDLLHEDGQYEPGGQADDEEVAEQNAQANFHVLARL